MRPLEPGELVKVRETPDRWPASGRGQVGYREAQVVEDLGAEVRVRLRRHSTLRREYGDWATGTAIFSKLSIKPNGA